MAKDVDFIGVLKNLIPILQNHAEVAGLVFFGIGKFSYTYSDGEALWLNFISTRGGRIFLSVVILIKMSISNEVIKITFLRITSRPVHCLSNE